MNRAFENLGYIIQKDGIVKPVILKARPLGAEEQAEAPKPKRCPVVNAYLQMQEIFNGLNK